MKDVIHNTLLAPQPLPLSLSLPPTDPSLQTVPLDDTDVSSDAPRVSLEEMLRQMSIGEGVKEKGVRVEGVRVEGVGGEGVRVEGVGGEGVRVDSGDGDMMTEC